MNFRKFIMLLFICILIVSGCSTDPEIDWDKLDDYYFISCKLKIGDEFQDNTQRIVVQRIRYLVDLAFNPNEGQTFGIEGAQALIRGPDSIYHFSDKGLGIYEFINEDGKNVFKENTEYTLQVNMPDSNIALSGIITPAIYFKPVEHKIDTIWIQPDSITSWAYPEGGGRIPLTIHKSGIKGIIHFQIPQGSLLVEPSKQLYDLWYSPFLISERLWYSIDTTATSLIISTASDSPSVFMSEFEPTEVRIRFNVKHKDEAVFDRFGNDDLWPIENLDAQSNFNGAYGIFTTFPIFVDKTYILALEKKIK